MLRKMTLQEQAKKIVTDLDLVTKLAPFGETHLVGSVAFGTTTKPDIDIQIYTAEHYEEVAPKIIEVLQNIGFTEIEGRRLRKSKKFLVLAKFVTNNTDWDVDITLTQPSKDYVRDSYHFYQDYFPKLTDEKRELIIKFKKEFGNLKISGDNPAFYIYNGVLNENVATSQEMLTYLNKKRIK